MSYLEQLKKLNMATIGSVVSIERPLDTLDTSDKRLVPEIQFLADAQIKRNQSRCPGCINLNPCPSARNIKGQCPTNYKLQREKL